LLTIPEGLGVLVIVSIDDAAVQQVVDLVHLLTVAKGAGLDTHTLGRNSA
jgi:hypothetical protein